MTTAPLDLLDADELFMLGLQSSSAGDSGSAIGYFKLTLSRSDRHAKAHWALAAEYAALKMPERATHHFASAVELDPHQPVARFQYGLLLLTSGQVAAAQEVWRPLDALDVQDSIRLFKDGLLLMVRGEFDAALVSLRAALVHPGLHPALARDVEMTIGRIEQTRADGGAVQSGTHGTPASPVAESVESHLAFSAYRSGSDGTH